MFFIKRYNKEIFEVFFRRYKKIINRKLLTLRYKDKKKKKKILKNI